MRQTISIITGTFNEKDNIVKLVHEIKKIMGRTKYDYEHIVIDNSSTDGTIQKLKKLAKDEKNLKVIVNSRNFGQIRSPYYGLLQASGDACINLPSDFEVPLKIIPELIKKWEEGNKIVYAVKIVKQKTLLNLMKNTYYDFLNSISDVNLIKNNSGFGLVDSEIINILKEINTPMPYFRGLLAEIGYDQSKVFYEHTPRKFNSSKNNFFSLYDYAMVGIVSHSKFPLKFMALCGFFISMICFVISLIYFILKLIYWDLFEIGQAPIIIGLFLFASLTSLCIGILGEYVYSLHTLTRKMPLVFEKERINFKKKK